MAVGGAARTGAMAWWLARTAAAYRSRSVLVWGLVGQGLQSWPVELSASTSLVQRVDMIV